MPSDPLLPLFPLELVLLPQSALPLHIFEERYKLMIGESLERHSEFGIVLSKENSLANAGCTAIVEKVIKRYADGRLDIVTLGRRRFDVLFLNEEKPYLQAGVHFFDDNPDTTPGPEAVRRLESLFERVLRFLPGQAREAAGSQKGVNSFQIAGVLPLDLELKQRLLCSRSEAERVTTLTEQLEKLLPRLETARRVERASRGNGRGA